MRSKGARFQVSSTCFIQTSSDRLMIFTTDCYAIDRGITDSRIEFIGGQVRKLTSLQQEEILQDTAIVYARQILNNDG